MKKTDSATLYTRLRRRAGRNTMKLLRSVVSEQRVHAFCGAVGHEYRKRVFTPYVTVCGMLIQALDQKKSQSNAVINLMGQLAASGLPTGSHDASGFCAARQRLPEAMLPWLMRQAGTALEHQVPRSVLPWGRPVKLVDGTTVSMPDTPENREYFGLPSGQADGCGFPLARVCGLFSLASGAALVAEVDPYRTSEREQWARLQQKLNPGDIAVGDRAFGSFADVVLLRRRGVDGIFRLHQTRPAPGGDWIERTVTWHKKKRPAGMSIQEFRALPRTQKVRLIRANQIDPDTKRRCEIIIVTTLLDKHRYPAKLIVELYGRRWEVEVDLRHVKSTLKMDILSGEKPQTVTLEIHAHLLAYNLLRTLMWQAGRRHGINPLRLSLERARQEMLAWHKIHGMHPRDKSCRDLLRAVASHKIPYRPGRVEPRVVKRRHSKFPYMTQSRDVLRNQLLQLA